MARFLPQIDDERVLAAHEGRTAAAPQRCPVSPDQRGRPSVRTWWCTRSPTSTAAGSAPGRGSGRSSRSSGAHDRRPTARSRATPSSAMESRSATQAFVGHGVIFINDNLPRATTEAGSSARRRRLGARSARRSSGCLARLGRRDPRRTPDRRGGRRRGRRRGHPRCSARAPRSRATRRGDRASRLVNRRINWSPIPADERLTGRLTASSCPSRR